jgi:hypothetical protein
VVSTKCIDPWVLEFVVSNIIVPKSNRKIVIIEYNFFMNGTAYEKNRE